MGYNDDILDMIWIPTIDDSTNQQQSNMDIDDDNNDHDPDEIIEKPIDKFDIVIITNSSQIKIMNQDFNYQLLDGHTDIVLAGDVTPDG